jgi:hypothetical protein
VLQAGGACYSWRFPPPRWLGGLWLHRSSQEDCVRLRRSFVRGIMLTPRGSRRETLVERVIELSHFKVGSCGIFGRLGCGYRLAAEPRGVGRHNGDIAWWQPSEPWEKITMSTLSTLLGGLPSCNTSLYLLSYISCLCCCSCIFLLV